MNLKSYLKQKIIDYMPVMSRSVFFKDQIFIRGNFLEWEDARKCSTGYDDEKTMELFLDQTIDELNKDKKNFEQDGIARNERVPNKNFINAIEIATSNEPKLKFLDFGGGLGSLFLNNFENSPNELKRNWIVFEQRLLVKKAIRIKRLKKLSFTNSKSKFLKNVPNNFIILSSVLQYLKDPMKTLEEVLIKKPKYIFIDRTPFLNSSGGPSILKLQDNPSYLGSSSYPIWLFAPDAFLNLFCRYGFKSITEFNSPDKLSHLATWKGGFWINKNVLS